MCSFAPVVSRPHGHGAPRVAWSAFHDTLPVGAPLGAHLLPAPGGVRPHRGTGALGGPGGAPPRGAGSAGPSWRGPGWAGPQPQPLSGHGTPCGGEASRDASPTQGARTPAEPASPPGGWVAKPKPGNGGSGGGGGGFGSVQGVVPGRGAAGLQALFRG